MSRRPLRIEKVLNSSVVLVQNEQGREQIVLDKGIGYGKKKGELILPSEDARMFSPAQNHEMNQLVELLSSIDSQFIEAASLVVDYAEAFLGKKLDPHIYLALTDHISFAVQRMKDGLILNNQLYWEIRTFYPREYRIGLYGLKVIKSLCHTELPDEEASNIAFHILNASGGGVNAADAVKSARLCSQIMNIVTYSIQWTPAEDSLHYSRFSTHVQYFVTRFIQGKLMDGQQSLYEHFQKMHPQAASIAEKIRSFMIRDYQCVLPDEEVGYLAIHIQRLIDEKNKSSIK